VSRFARVQRTTKESDVLDELQLAGTGDASVETGVPFYDHMLAQLGKHGGLDLTVRTVGDLQVDAHHTVEDTSLALGQALREALGDKAGLRRYGDALTRWTRPSCRSPSICRAGPTWCTPSRSWWS
jgi:imidazoleglycerol-phosphate dehydratase